MHGSTRALSALNPFKSVQFVMYDKANEEAYLSVLSVPAAWTVFTVILQARGCGNLWIPFEKVTRKISLCLTDMENLILGDRLATYRYVHRNLD